MWARQAYRWNDAKIDQPRLSSINDKFANSERNTVADARRCVAFTENGNVLTDGWWHISPRINGLSATLSAVNAISWFTDQKLKAAEICQEYAAWFNDEQLHYGEEGVL